MRQEFIQLLRTDQAFREEVRRQLLTEDLLALPEKFDHLVEVVRDLAEAQARTEARVGRLEEAMAALAEAQRRTEARVSRLEETVAALAEAQQRTEEGLQRLEAQVERQGEQLRALTEAQQRQGEQIQALAEAQRRTEQRVEELAEAQRRTEDGLQRLGEQIQALVEVQREAGGILHRLDTWYWGEKGRRDGERYERETVRRAPVLFYGGRGGSPDQPWVQQYLTERLGSLVANVTDPEEDPFLADLIWWKGDRVAVTEISLQVNGQDITRAARRAEILKQAGLDAVAVVIGEEWAIWEAQEAAVARQVEWKVGKSFSEGFIALRRAQTE